MDYILYVVAYATYSARRTLYCVCYTYCTLFAEHFTLYDVVQCTARCVLYYVYYTMCSVQSVLCDVYCVLCDVSVQCVLYAV